MIFLTGDKHGDYAEVERFCQRFSTTKNDVLVVLGDNGVNFYGSKDSHLKKKLQALPITFVMVRGNHDQRPSEKLYKISDEKRPDLQGRFLVEDEYPSLLFARDGNTYTINDQEALILGGAYSVDKYYRLEMQEHGYKNYRWFSDEQMTSKEKAEVEKALDYIVHPVFETKDATMPSIIFSHTCPFQYIPRDSLNNTIDRSLVDDSMEHWLDKINDIVKPQKWFCGHWHIDKTIDNIRFMYNDFVELD